MKITMFEIEATPEDLRASRSVSEALSCAIQRVVDTICGYTDPFCEVEQEETDEQD